MPIRAAVAEQFQQSLNENPHLPVKVLGCLGKLPEPTT